MVATRKYLAGTAFPSCTRCDTMLGYFPSTENASSTLPGMPPNWL